VNSGFLLTKLRGDKGQWGLGIGEIMDSDSKHTHIAKGRRKRAEGFYVYYWYLVISAIKSVLTFMATAISYKNVFKGSQSLVPSPAIC
jgi:hypothetical protein